MLMPPLAVLQDDGFRVALVTDGRMSGASGKVPAAIHVTPECLAGGALRRIRSGDPILLDPKGGILQALISEDELERREPAGVDLSRSHFGYGRELFATLRERVGSAEDGATSFGLEATEHHLCLGVQKQPQADEQATAKMAEQSPIKDAFVFGEQDA